MAKQTARVPFLNSLTYSPHFKSLRLLALGSLLNALWCCFTLAQTSLESIEVKHQTAQAVLDKLASQLQPGEEAVASGRAILLTADASRIAAIRDLIGQLDRPAQYALVETRLGPLNQLLQSGAFENDVVVTSRGQGGVVVIGGPSGASGARLVSQSMRMAEAVKSSLSLSNAQALTLKTLEGREKGPPALVASALRIGAQSGLWLAWYAADANTTFVEIAPRITLQDSGMPLRTLALLPIATNQWVTVAEDEEDKRAGTERFVLQIRLSTETALINTN